MARMRVRLTFPPALIQEPIVYRLVKDFDIVINIRRARGQGGPRLDRARLEGDEGALERGVRWLKDRGVQVDPIERRRDRPVVEISRRVQSFTESVIREMTRVVDQVGGVNLAQGMPNFPPPPELIAAAHRAIDGDFHQYAVTWGAPSLRQAIAAKYRAFYGMDVGPDRHVTVCCGSTETMLSTLLAVLESGRRGHHLRAVLRELRAGMHHRRARCPLFVPLEPPDFVVRSGPVAGGRDAAARARSSSTAPIIQPARSSRATSSRPSPISASSTTCWRSPTRSTSTSSTTGSATRPSPRSRAWPSARSPSPASRSRTRSPAGGLATRWRPGAGDRHPARSRLRHGGGAAPAPGSRGDGLRAARVLLRRAPRVVPGAPRSPLGLSREGRIRGVEAARRLLHPHRRGPLPEAVQPSGRHGVRDVAHQERRGRDGPRFLLLRPPGARPDQDQILLPKTDDMLRDAGERLLKLRP